MGRVRQTGKGGLETARPWSRVGAEGIVRVTPGCVSRVGVVEKSETVRVDFDPSSVRSDVRESGSPGSGRSLGRGSGPGIGNPVPGRVVLRLGPPRSVSV